MSLSPLIHSLHKFLKKETSSRAKSFSTHFSSTCFSRIIDDDQTVNHERDNEHKLCSRRVTFEINFRHVLTLLLNFQSHIYARMFDENANSENVSKEKYAETELETKKKLHVEHSECLVLDMMLLNS
jgi:hypothetical protein